ncbi:MAG TPA: nuclear transport factor 2 family protein [Candidatus Acidoferrales bacterium]|nr:nuclear transport factor 2 family protein [Candidatus Acidoferrales bacterium]
MKRFGGFPRVCVCFLAAVLIGCLSFNAEAGQKKKKTKDAAPSAQPAPPPLASESDQIDHDIGEMLAGFQIGDIELMHKYYSDNATFVSGDYEPPIVGWQNYVAIYQRERAAFGGMQLIRKNTDVFIHGDVAWAAYQWEFDSMLNDKPYSIRGQTTLVFNKVGDNWLIVHNHTSEIVPPAAAAQQQAGQSPAPSRAPVPVKP